MSKKLKQLFAAGGLTVAAAPSFAALPTDAAAAFTSMTTYAGDVMTASWAIWSVVAVGFILMRLVSRGVRQGSRG